MEVTEKQDGKSKRDLLKERLMQKYPDKNFDDEEDFFGSINDDYADYDQKLGGYKKNEESLANLFSSDPRSAAFLNSWKQGEDPVMSLIRTFGDDFKLVLEDPDKQEELAKAHGEYLERLTNEKNLEDEYQKNLAQSLEDLQKLQEEKGYPDEQVDNAMELITGIASDFIVGKITPETMELAFKAINHDEDVETAAHEASVKEKNNKIKEAKLRTTDGDLPPTLNGKGANAATREMPSFGALDKYADGSKSIWERGGEKRIKR